MKRRARKKGRVDREKWLARIWKWYRRKQVCEYLCDECSKLYVEKPKGIEQERLVSGSSTARIFVEQAYGRRNYYVEFARSKAYHDKLVLSPLFTRDHLIDVARVAAMACQYIEVDEQRHTRRSRHRLH